MNILLVEDNELLTLGLTQALRGADHKVTHAGTGCDAEAVLRAYEFNLVILDLGLPDMDGISLLKQLRGRSNRVPVLVLTARDGIDDRVAALDAGADDYMDKPFDLRELEARIRALLRRSLAQGDEHVHVGPVTIDPFQRRVSLQGQPLELPAREYQILEILALEAPRAVSKQKLALRLSLDNSEIGENAVEVYIHRLRQRLMSEGIGIRTRRGIGYVLEVTRS